MIEKVVAFIMEDTILKIENVSKSYPGMKALKHINMTIKRGKSGRFWEKMGLESQH